MGHIVPWEANSFLSYWWPLHFLKAKLIALFLLVPLRICILQAINASFVSWDCGSSLLHHLFDRRKKNLSKHYLYPRQPLKMSALQVLPSPKADFLEVPGWEAPSGGESQDTSQKKCVPITAASMFSGVCSSLLSSSKCSMIIFECDQAHTCFFWKYWQYCFWGVEVILISILKRTPAQ